MKKLLLSLSLATALFMSGCASPDATHSQEQHGEVEKKGFLTTKWCMDNGMLKDCRLETVVCGEENCFKKWDFGQEMKTELVLFVHNEGTYNIKLGHSGHLHLSHVIEEGLNKNDVTIKGHLNGNTIEATELKAPPPAGKSFFKGCL